MVTDAELPSEHTAEEIFGLHFEETVSRVTRFPTGLCHYVYEVVTAGGDAYVIRIAPPGSRAYIEGGLYWHPILAEAGVPVPALHAGGVHGPFAYMLIERLPGDDLGHVYGELSPAQRQSLAGAVADIQKAVHRLPAAGRYGFGFSYEHVNSTGKESWLEVVRQDVARSEKWIRNVGRVDERFVARTRAVLADHEDYLRSVAPTPFLDDMTTKNVIVHDGALSGIVDTDMVCFGDPLATIGLTNMALLSLGMDTDYIDFWLSAMRATAEQRAMVRVYSLTSCLCFMGELGQQFNGPVDFSEEKAEHFRTIFEELAADQGN